MCCELEVIMCVCLRLFFSGFHNQDPSTPNGVNKGGSGYKVPVQPMLKKNNKNQQR